MKCINVKLFQYLDEVKVIGGSHCILQFDKETGTLWIAFRGTVFTDLEDILSDMDFKWVTDQSWPMEAKFHKGFHDASRKCLLDIKSELEKFSNTLKKVVLTGHSLGAAVAAVTHILLIRDLKEMGNDMPIETVTFALPMFGNNPLRTELEKLEKEDQRFGNLYNFVFENDIIPSCELFDYAYSKLTKVTTHIINFAIEFEDHIIEKLFHFDSKVVDEVDYASNKWETLHKPKNELPCFDMNDTDRFVPIGKYLYMCENGKMYDIEDKSFGPQFPEMFLLNSLNALSKIRGIFHFKDAIKEIAKSHQFRNYEAIVNYIFSTMRALPN